MTQRHKGVPKDTVADFGVMVTALEKYNQGNAQSEVAKRESVPSGSVYFRDGIHVVLGTKTSYSRMFGPDFW